MKDDVAKQVDPLIVPTPAWEHPVHFDGMTGMMTGDTALMSFIKEDNTVDPPVSGRGYFDIVGGKFDYRGNLPISDAARMLFDILADNVDDWWIERALRKQELKPTGGKG